MEVHAYIEVTDLQAGIDFYTQGLGLSLRRRLDDCWVELTGASIPIFLLSDRPPVARLGERDIARDFSRHWTPVHLDFVTDNLEGAVQQAEAAGGVLEREIQVREWGRMASMADPFGNGFDLIELAPGGYDRIERTT